jgi:hypothetical protein
MQAVRDFLHNRSYAGSLRRYGIAAHAFGLPLQHIARLQPAELAKIAFMRRNQYAGWMVTFPECDTNNESLVPFPSNYKAELCTENQTRCCTLSTFSTLSCHGSSPVTWRRSIASNCPMCFRKKDVVSRARCHQIVKRSERTTGLQAWF